MVKIVVLTGGIGSGKTTASKIFEFYNIKVIDTDLLARKLTDKDGRAIEILKKEFDPSFFRSDGSLNRKKMRFEIFSNMKQKLKLEEILHPMITQDLKHETNNAESPYVVHVIPLWLEKNKNLRSSIWKLIVVDCCESTQKLRAINRSKLDFDTFNQIKSNQVSRSTRLKAADIIINNDGGVNQLKPQITKIHSYLLDNI